MARTATKKLDSRTARAKLPPGWHFATLSAGRSLGYLKPSVGAGRWRAREETGRTESGTPLRRYNMLGDADDHVPANGTTILSYAQALAQAVEWQPEDKATKLRVRQAVAAHVENLRASKGDDAAKDAEQRLRKHVLREAPDGKRVKGGVGLGDDFVDELKLTALRTWRNKLLEGGKRSRATANRIVADFKAALNSAFSDEANGIASDSAWRRLETFENATSARIDHFSEPEILRLIDAARATPTEEGGPEEAARFADMLEAGFLTGARYGELCAVDVRHFDAKHRQLTIPERRPGLRVKTGGRIVVLTPEAVELFARLAAGRAGDLPLLSPDGTERWGKSMQHRRIKAALAKAKLSASATFYVLRHSHISRAIEANVPLTLIAENCGTSVKMIEKHYAKILAAKRRELVERGMPRLRGVVTPIKRGTA